MQQDVYENTADRAVPQAETHQVAGQEAGWPSRSLPAMAGIYIRGLAMGAADIVPGVSGGTMAFIFGIYEELINSIKTVGQRAFIDAVLHLRLREAFSLINWTFLVPLGLGVLTAIFTLAGALEYLLNHQPVYIWSFFFGLIIASVIVIGRRIQSWNWVVIAAILLGAVSTFWLVSLVPHQTPDTWWFYLLTGALASCAMILPGISGAYILVMLGKYQTVLGAVNQRDFLTLALIAMGAAIGLVTFAQILSWLFKRYHDYTVALLMGLLLGSLRKVWPWKVDLRWLVDENGRFVLEHGERIVIEQINVLPDVSSMAGVLEVLAALVLAGLGMGGVLLIEWVAGRGSRQSAGQQVIGSAG
jgi:putative membrane protein